MMLWKEALSAIALMLTFWLFWPYMRSIQRGETLPHVLSWAIWAFGTFVVFIAQLAGGAGVGAWPIGVSACLTGGVAWMAFTRRDRIEITTGDWFLFALAASALPLWMVTQDPLWAVVLLTLADLVGFGPTLRRVHSHPYSEHLGFFALGALRNALVIGALATYSAVTVLFPLLVGIACLLVSAYIGVRRVALPKPT